MRKAVNLPIINQRSPCLQREKLLEGEEGAGFGGRVVWGVGGSGVGGLGGREVWGVVFAEEKQEE